MASRGQPLQNRAEPRLLVPVFIAVDREGARLREDLIWAVNEASVSAPAAKFCAEFSLPAGYERQVEAQIVSCVQPYQAAAQTVCGSASGTNSCLTVDVSAVHGSPLQTFRDRLEWDVAAAPGSVARYAARVCADLGLDWSWQRPIAAALRQELQAAAPWPAGASSRVERHAALRPRSPDEAAAFAGFPRVEPAAPRDAGELGGLKAESLL